MKVIRGYQVLQRPELASKNEYFSVFREERENLAKYQNWCLDLDSKRHKKKRVDIDFFCRYVMLIFER